MKSKLFFAIDSGYILGHKIGEFSECPNDLKAIPPQCGFVDLACVAAFEDSRIRSSIIKYMWNIFDARTVYHVELVINDLIPSALLIDPDGACLQTVLLRDGAVKLDGQPKTDWWWPEFVKADAEAQEHKTGGWKS
jgi:hypothetical protein